MSFYSHRITLFFIIVKTVLQTDFFRNKFRYTNNLFGPPYATFLKTKRKDYGDIIIAIATGVGGPAVPWRANAGVGWEGKMKLCFVKFLTSRENEIEKKEEEEEGLKLQCLFSPS